MSNSSDSWKLNNSLGRTIEDELAHVFLSLDSLIFEIRTLSGVYDIRPSNLMRGLLADWGDVIATHLGLASKDQHKLDAPLRQIDQLLSHRVNVVTAMFSETSNRDFIVQHRQTLSIGDSNKIWAPYSKQKALVRVFEPLENPPDLFEPLEAFQVECSKSSLLAPLSSRLLEHLKRKWPTLVRQVMAEIDAFAVIRPRRILGVNWLGTHGEASRAYANFAGIEWICLQHGISYGWSQNLMTRRVDADLFLTWGDGYTAEVSATSGTQCLSVLNPAYEGLSPSYGKDEVRQVLVAPTSLPPYEVVEAQAFWQTILDIAARHSHLSFVLRPHRKGTIPTKIRASNVSVSSPWESGIMEALEQCDVLISNPGTTVLDACFQGRPVILAACGTDPEFITHWGNISPTPVDQIEATLLSLNHEWREDRLHLQDQFVKSYFWSDRKVRDVLRDRAC